MFKPKHYPNLSCAFCTYKTGNGNWLEPHIENITARGKVKTYHIDFWFCPVCGTMYHLPKYDRIVE